MSNYQSRDSQVLARQLKVQRLVIPFKIVGNATAASVLITRDEPALLFVKTAGVDEITPALSSTDTAPTLTAANDSTGAFNLMLKINEPIAKVMHARVVRRDVVNKVYECALDNSGTGIVIDTALSSGGDKIVLFCQGDLALNTSNTLDACVVCEYVVDQSVDPTSLFS